MRDFRSCYKRSSASLLSAVLSLRPGYQVAVGRPVQPTPPAIRPFVSTKYVAQHEDLTVLNAHKIQGQHQDCPPLPQADARDPVQEQPEDLAVHPSGVITDKNNQQLEGGTGPEATLALSNATLDLEWFIWNELVANIDHWATLQKLEKRYGPQDDQAPTAALRSRTSRRSASSPGPEHPLPRPARTEPTIMLRRLPPRRTGGCRRRVTTAG